jgi:hypothetical protein
MKRTQLITDLTKYTDYNKARAFETLVENMQALLEDYQNVEGDTAEVVSLLSAKLLMRAWNLLIDLDIDKDKE